MLSLFVVLSALLVVRGGLLESIPEDTHAFPKYRVAFLNNYPVSNATAQKWLSEGLRGGELEFLGQWQASNAKEIASSEAAALQHEEQTVLSDQNSHDVKQTSSPVLEQMRLGPSKSYLCLIPPAPSLPPPPPEDSQSTVTPSHSWSLLQPLSGTCLYHRQAWFTYSYCHNLHVRQFRELPIQIPHPPGPVVVEEDPEWEAYTLGRSPAAQASADGTLSANDELALANNLELAHGAGQRYLVQRWGDGTICDKTGRPREIEIQFHCSMTTTDTILFVKETRTCEYVLVIHTPRLCGEPGFKSRLETMPEAAIRCRRILDADTPEPEMINPENVLFESKIPSREKSSRLPPVPPPVQRAQPPKTGKSGVVDTRDRIKLLQRAIEEMLGAKSEELLLDIQPGDDDGEFFIMMDEGALNADTMDEDMEAIMKAAGYDVVTAQKEDKKKKKKTPEDETHEKDEL